MSAEHNSVKLEAPYSKPPKAVRVPSGKAKPTSVSQTTKFYDGPTVPASSTVPALGDPTTVSAVKMEKTVTTRTRTTARRHPWSLISILTTIPFLLAISLVSTIACPPTQTKSSLSHFVLSPFGLHDGSSQHSQLHQTLCYPANVYHDQVLQPYVYPVIDDIKARAASHPVYSSVIVPAQVQATRVANQAQAIAQPIVERIHRGIRRIYLTFVEPHIPYLTARYHSITAPYTTRASALYKTYIAPYVNTLFQHGQTAGKKTVETYNWAAGHPLTGHAGRYANHGYRFSRAKGQQAYEYSRPHAIRFAKEADRIARHVIGPKAVDAIEWVILKIQLGTKEARAHACAIYTAHLEPHVGPYITKANTAISPYTSAFNAKVYTPYIRPALVAVLPPAVIPQAPRTFWDLVSDILPGSRIGEHRADLSYTEKAKKAAKSVDDKSKKASAKAKETVKSTAQQAAKVFDRAEMNRIFTSAKKQIDAEGKKGYDRVRKELVEFNSKVLTDDDSFPTLKGNARAEIDRDIDYLTKGLDKLYTTSTVLTREQVAQSSKQADARVAKKLADIKARVEKVRARWNTQSSSIVRDVLTDIEKTLGPEWTTLPEKMAWLDDITPKDWTTYNSLTDSLDSWSKKYIALHSGESKDRALSAPSANINRAVAAMNNELDEVFEGFRDMINTLKQTALSRIEAREVVAEESASSLSKVASKSASSVSKSASSASKAAATKAEDGRVSILPIVEGAGAAAAAGAAISKGKQQIVDALNQAETATPVAGRARASAASAYDAASDQAQSAYNSASSAVHDATRSVASAVGATPSPETPAEHLDSVVAAAKDAYTSVGDSVHSATRAGKKAVGVQPTPEGIAEQVESIASEISASVSSVGSAAAASAASFANAAGDALNDLTAAVSDAAAAKPTQGSAEDQVVALAAAASASIESAASAASVAVHEATRAAVRAAGATPSPESPKEYAESIANVASAAAGAAYADAADSLASIYINGASNAGVAAAAVTDQAAQLASQIQSALGLVRTPEPIASTASSYLAYLSSAAATALPDALSSGQAILSSLEAEAGSSLHSATRAASKAAGATPTPETAAEYVEAAQAKVDEYASKARQAVSRDEL